MKRRNFHNIRCYAYSIPAIVNRAASHLFDGFLMSIVAGDDVVARMNLHSLELLRADVNRLLENCDLPKYKIFASAIKSYIKGNKSKSARLLDETQGGTVPQNNNTTSADELKKIAESALSIPKKMRLGNQAHFIHTIRGSCPPMFIPGRILYLEKVRNTGDDTISIKVEQQTEVQGSRLKRGTQSIAKFISVVKEKFVIMQHKPVDFKYYYSPRWADKEEFQEIIISRSMIRDHTVVFGIMREWEECDPNKPLKALS